LKLQAKICNRIRMVAICKYACIWSKVIFMGFSAKERCMPHHTRALLLVNVATDKLELNMKNA